MYPYALTTTTLQSMITLHCIAKLSTTDIGYRFVKFVEIIMMAGPELKEIPAFY